MSFKRQGTPEDLEPVMFKCPRCGKVVVTLINGMCELCGMNQDDDKLKKTSKKVSKHKK